MTAEFRILLRCGAFVIVYSFICLCLFSHICITCTTCVYSGDQSFRCQVWISPSILTVRTDFVVGFLNVSRQVGRKYVEVNHSRFLTNPVSTSPRVHMLVKNFCRKFNLAKRNWERDFPLLNSGAQISGAGSPRRINFLQWPLTLVDPQYGAWYMSVTLLPRRNLRELFDFCKICSSLHLDKDLPRWTSRWHTQERKQVLPCHILIWREVCVRSTY